MGTPDIAGAEASLARLFLCLQVDFLRDTFEGDLKSVPLVNRRQGLGRFLPDFEASQRGAQPVA